MTEQHTLDRMDPALWQRRDMRTALASRDVAAVFRLLQRVGISQRRIAALTGQSQSEISEILAGRHVVSYDVLARIADGLGVPRGQLGLAYDEMTAQMLDGTVATAGDDDESRQVIARLTELTVGAAPIDPATWSRPFALAWAPAPDHIGVSDIGRLEDITRQLRAMDHEHGGGACRDAVLAQLAWAQQLLRADVGEEAARALHIAVADLHLLAGWTSFDIGMVGPARRHYARAMEHARYVEEPSLVAKVLYCLGRLHLHHGWSGQALKLFQLCQVAAQQSGIGRAEAMVHANLAWAHAVIGESRQAAACIERARELFARTEEDELPRWIQFFDSAELQAIRGAAMAALPDPTPAERAEAIERFQLSTAMRELTQARPRAFELTALSWLLFDEGAVAEAVRAGNEAVELAVRLRSTRVTDRMAPLRARLAVRVNVGDVRELAERIKALPLPP